MVDADCAVDGGARGDPMTKRTKFHPPRQERCVGECKFTRVYTVPVQHCIRCDVSELEYLREKVAGLERLLELRKLSD